MNKQVNFMIFSMLVLSMFAGSVSGQDIMMESEAIAIKEPASFDPEQFTKIEISPRYGHIRLQPGDSKEIKVTVKNKEKETIEITPHVEIPPYGEYLIEKQWIEITPESKAIPEGEKQDFVVKATIPEDASIGYYNARIVMTDDVMQTPYPSPFPEYVHSFDLSIDVWTPPKIQIIMPYITDQLEAGNEYDYNVKLKNVGEEDIAIDPQISNEEEMYYGGPFGMIEPAFEDDAITITSPGKVAAGESVEVNIHIKVPADAKGNYHGAIDLGIDDPSIREWEGLVRMDFGIWKQPTEPFIKEFTTDEATVLTIEINSNMFGDFPYPGLGRSDPVKNKEPGFKVTLSESDTEIPLKKTKTIIKGGVSLGGMDMWAPPWEQESEGIYKEMSVQFIETYTADVPAGNLELGIMPENTQTFEYTLIIGE